MKGRAGNRLLLGGLVVLGLWIGALVLSDRAEPRDAVDVTRASAPSASVGADVRPLQGPVPPSAVPETPRAHEPSQAPAPTTRLVCRRRVDGAPVAGVSVFAGGASLAGPSDASGVLAFTRSRAQPLTVWGAGWRPVFVRGFEELPAEVLLDPAVGRLEVRLFGLSSGARIDRSLLQPHAFSVAGDEPWRPRLTDAGPDRLIAEALPEGSYDVYVWVSEPAEPVRCLSAAGVRVEGPQPVRLELDAAAGRAAEED